MPPSCSSRLGVAVFQREGCLGEPRGPRKRDGWGPEDSRKIGVPLMLLRWPVHLCAATCSSLSAVPEEEGNRRVPRAPGSLGTAITGLRASGDKGLSPPQTSLGTTPLCSCLQGLCMACLMGIQPEFSRSELSACPHPYHRPRHLSQWECHPPTCSRKRPWESSLTFWAPRPTSKLVSIA